MITLTLQDFASALARAVKGKPKDYVYEAVVSVCLNFHPPQGAKRGTVVMHDWTPGCIIGTAVVNAGVSVREVADCSIAPTGNYSALFSALGGHSILELGKYDEQAILSLAAHAQYLQDGRQSWPSSVMGGCDNAVSALEGRLTTEQVRIIEALYAEIKEYVSE